MVLSREHNVLGAMQSVDGGDVRTKAYANQELPKPVQGDSVLQRSKARVNFLVTSMQFLPKEKRIWGEGVSLQMRIQCLTTLLQEVEKSSGPPCILGIMLAEASPYASQECICRQAIQRSSGRLLQTKRNIHWPDVSPEDANAQCPACRKTT